MRKYFAALVLVLVAAAGLPLASVGAANAPDAPLITKVETRNRLAILTWDDVEGAVGYNVYRNGHMLETIPLGEMPYDDINAAGQYTYYVTALNAENDESGESNEIEADTTKQTFWEMPEDERPVAEEPVIEEPVVEDPVAEEPVVEDPLIAEPDADEPIVVEPAIEPVIEEPAAEEQAAEEPIDVEPAEPVIEEPTIDEPALSTIPRISTVETHKGLAVFTWNSIPGAVQYKVYRNGRNIETIPASEIPYDDRNAPGQYTYEISSVDRDGHESGKSGAIAVDTTAHTTWTNGTTSVLDNLQVEEEADAEEPVVQTPVEDAPAVETPKKTDPVEEAPVVEAKPQPVVADTSAELQTPHILTVETHKGLAILTWDDVDRAVKYKVFRNGRNIETIPVGEMPYDDRNAAGQYTYRIQAVDAAGNESALSNEIEADTTRHSNSDRPMIAQPAPEEIEPTVALERPEKTRDVEPTIAPPIPQDVEPTIAPEAPSATIAPPVLSVEGGTGEAVLRWEAVPGATGYNVYRNDKYLTTTSKAGNTDRTVPGTHEYYVTSFDEAKEPSTKSNKVTATVVSAKQAAEQKAVAIAKSSTTDVQPKQITPTNRSAIDNVFPAVESSITVLPKPVNPTADPVEDAAFKIRMVMSDAGRAQLGWQPVPGATGYNIYREGPRSGVDGYLTTLSGNRSTWFVDQGTAREGWTYYVTATGLNNTFPKSNKVTIRSQDQDLFGGAAESNMSQRCRDLRSFRLGCHSSGGAWTAAFTQFAPKVGVKSGSPVGARVRFFPDTDSVDVLDRVVYIVGPYLPATNESEDQDSLSAERRTVRRLVPSLGEIESTLNARNVSIVYIGFGNLEDSQQSISQRVVATKAVIRQFESLRTADRVGEPGPSALVGLSLGGVVGKIALTELEASGFRHNVDTYMSVDSPHWGAYTPAALQMVPIFTEGAFNWAGNGFGNLSSDLQDGEDGSELAIELTLKSPVAQDTLITNFAYADYRSPNINYIRSRARALPKQTTENIAVASGAINGVGPNLRDEFFSINTGKSSNYFKPLLTGSAKVPSVQNPTFFQGQMSLKQFSSFQWKRVYYTRNRTLHQSDITRLERSPCAHSSKIVREMVNQLNRSLNQQWNGVNITPNEVRACFIPTYSAVAGNADNHRSTAFDRVIGDNSNAEHLDSSPDMNRQIVSTFSTLFPQVGTSTTTTRPLIPSLFGRR